MFWIALSNAIDEDWLGQSEVLRGSVELRLPHRGASSFFFLISMPMLVGGGDIDWGRVGGGRLQLGHGGAGRRPPPMRRWHSSAQRLVEVGEWSLGGHEHLGVVAYPSDAVVAEDQCRAVSWPVSESADTHHAVALRRAGNGGGWDRDLGGAAIAPPREK